MLARALPRPAAGADSERKVFDPAGGRALSHNHRVAQLVRARIALAEAAQVDALDSTSEQCASESVMQQPKGS